MTQELDLFGRMNPVRRVVQLSAPGDFRSGQRRYCSKVDGFEHRPSSGRTCSPKTESHLADVGFGTGAAFPRADTVLCACVSVDRNAFRSARAMGANEARLRLIPADRFVL
jgi:hypothetical protein